MDKDYNELKKKVCRMETKKWPNEEQTSWPWHVHIVCVSLSFPFSISWQGLWLSCLLCCYRSPTPPHCPGSHDRGGYSRARHTHKEQFFQAHNAASEYRKDFERKRASGGRWFIEPDEKGSHATVRVHKVTRVDDHLIPDDDECVLLDDSGCDKSIININA